MPLPKLVKIEDLYEFANLVSGKYFYILKKYSDNEYLIQIDEDKSTQYDFVIDEDEKENVVFKILGEIDKNKKYKASLIKYPSLEIDRLLLIYEPEYFVKEFKDNQIKNSIELKEENKKIEELFNQLRSVLTGISEGTAIKQNKSIVEIVKAEDRPIDQKQFNVFEELYKEAEIQKRLKRVKLYETEKKVKEKEEEYGLEDENEEGDDDEWNMENNPWKWKNWHKC